MKKKNVLTMALSVSLVGVIAVGGTLAYLTSTTATVTNTFYGSDGIKMTLDEAPVDPDTGKVTTGERRTSNTYNNVLPGVDYDKDPTVHVTEVPDDGADVYVVIKGLPDSTKNYTVDYELNSKLDSVAGYTNLYKYDEVVDSAQDIVVFDGIKFDFDNDAANTEGFTIDQILVQAYAIQTGAEPEGTTVDAMAATALGATATTPAQVG